MRWVLECQRPGGGFGGSPRHDPHLLYTTSAVQILALYDRLDAVDADKTAACELHHGVYNMPPSESPAAQQTTCRYSSAHDVADVSLLGADVASLQREGGSFSGDEWGEVDTRCVDRSTAVPAGPCVDWCETDAC